jgi:hypothetical protein
VSFEGRSCDVLNDCNATIFGVKQFKKNSHAGRRCNMGMVTVYIGWPEKVVSQEGWYWRGLVVLAGNLGVKVKGGKKLNETENVLCPATERYILADLNLHTLFIH